MNISYDHDDVCLQDTFRVWLFDPRRGAVIPVNVCVDTEAYKYASDNACAPLFSLRDVDGRTGPEVDFAREGHPTCSIRFRGGDGHTYVVRFLVDAWGLYTFYAPCACIPGYIARAAPEGKLWGAMVLSATQVVRTGPSGAIVEEVPVDVDEAVLQHRGVAAEGAGSPAEFWSALAARIPETPGTYCC